MCSRCYAEKVVKPMEELEAALAEIRRVNSGKAAAAHAAEARNPAPSGCAAVCRRWTRVGPRNCS
ncbi:hypothetical protein ACP4OV_020119 [Aristida adscensionis]